MLEKQKEELLKVIDKVDKKFRRKNSDRGVPSWDKVKSNLESVLGEHMWSILIMNAEDNKAGTYKSFSAKDDCLCLWINRLFKNMEQHLNKDKVTLLKINESDATMPWWNNVEKIRELLKQRKKSESSATSENHGSDLNDSPQERDEAALQILQMQVKNFNPSTDPVEMKENLDPKTNQIEQAKTNQNEQGDDNEEEYYGPNVWTSASISSMWTIQDFVKKMKDDRPELGLLSRQALQTEQFRAQTILKALQSGKIEFHFDERKDMLRVNIAKSNHEAERKYNEEKLRAFECVLDASEIMI